MTKLALAMAVLAACGGGGDSFSADEYPQEFRDAICSNLASCGLVKDLDTCSKLNLLTSDSALFDPHWTASQLAAFDMNKTSFNSSKARACLDAIASAGCEFSGLLQRGLQPDECTEIFAGTLHAGETCALDQECVSFNCNAPTVCSQACCTGACVGDTPPPRLANLGESCAAAGCVSSTYCDLTSEICMALKPLNSPCADTSECQLELSCAGPSQDEGTCISLPKIGEACQGFCQDIGATCTNGTCVKYAIGGEACVTSDDCSPLYFCDGTRHCSGGPALGAACQRNEVCADARAFCDTATGSTTGTCALPKANGQQCEAGFECESHTCDGTQCLAEPVCI